MNNKIEELSTILKNSNNIVFFGGAGMSTDTGNKVHKKIEYKYIITYILKIYYLKCI